MVDTLQSVLPQWEAGKVRIVATVGSQRNHAIPAVPTVWSTLPLRWDGFDVGGRAPDLAHCCRGVAIEAFSLVPAHA